MQNDHVMNKLNFYPLTPSLGLWEEGGGGGSADKIFCCHIVASLILFNLICNMTMF